MLPQRGVLRAVDGPNLSSAAGAGVRGAVWARAQSADVTLYFGGGRSEPKIRELYEHMGVQISAGQLSNLLAKGQQLFCAQEKRVCEAGLNGSLFQHIAQTSTWVHGHNQHRNIVSNPLHTVYTTTPSKDRSNMLDVPRNGRERRFQLNDKPLGYLESTALSEATRNSLSTNSSDQDWVE